MPRPAPPLSQTLLAVLAFVLAAGVMTAAALGVAVAIENRTAAALEAKLAEAQIGWITVATDGLQVHLTGTAPSERDRFRALNLVGSVIDSSRIREALDVTPPRGVTAPHFSVEMLRNDDGVQLIGLVPARPAEGGMGAADLAAAAAELTPGSAPADMLQQADYPPPATWDAALRFGLKALALLQRAKISVSAERVQVTAISDSEADRKRFEAELRGAQPEGVALVLDISAPRPVITPFTLRFIRDGEGVRFDSCSADTAKARRAILAAAAEAGMQGVPDCTVGMGAPSPRWADAVRAAIRAVAAMEAGSATFSDTDLTFAAGEGTSQAAFDRALGDLRAALPDAFSLEAVPPRPDAAMQGPAEFTATLSPDGRVELRGRLVDEAQQAAVAAFARAEFTAAGVYVATRLDPELPDGWPIRVMAGLEALGELHDGRLVVRADMVGVTGVAASPKARARITQILSARLGQGQKFSVDVHYDHELDPEAPPPTPEECATQAQAVLAGQKITFTPGSTEIAGASLPLLGKLAEVLKQCPGIRMEIAGYTDSQGAAERNQALSRARAEAVLMALQGRGVDVAGMVAVGYGAADPIADNGTPEGREANRRIEFNLIGDEPADDGEAVPDAAGPAAGAATEAAADGAADGITNGAADDGGPSLAPTDKTIRPRHRPASGD